MMKNENLAMIFSKLTKTIKGIMNQVMNRGFFMFFKPNNKIEIATKGPRNKPNIYG